MKRILFVCHGNICRSPMAEYIMCHLLATEAPELEVEVDSAATTNDEIGSPIYPSARRKLAEYGVPYGDHRARRIVPEDYQQFDYIIGMDRENERDLRSFFHPDTEGKLSLLMWHAGERRDVTDPWYSRNFTAAYNDILKGCRALLQELKGNQR